MQCLGIRRTATGPTNLAKPNVDTVGYAPADLASAYRLPSVGGDGITVAIVDAYDDPAAESDLAVYRSQWGLAPCTTANGCFRKVSQRGNSDYPAPDEGWAGEISLDLDAVSAVCPNCHLLLVEADDNSADNLGVAVDQAVASGATVVSNSYGGPESAQMIADVEHHYQHPGVAIVASSGDDGYGASYPASSPYVTSVGGTSLTRDATTARGWSETVWNNYAGAPGSGCSALENKPFFQSDTGCANRTVADVSALADPITGLAVYQSYGGFGWAEYGGTSLASPIIAGVYALAGVAAAGDTPNWYPYAATTGLNDITSGTNGTCDPAYLCTAGPGYDGPTGLGTPDGVSAFAPPGPHGHIAGTVTDTASGATLANATVTVTGAANSSVTATTDAAGRYNVTEPVGDYQLAVSAFGHISQSAQATVTDGQTTNADVGLTPQPLVTLSGQVTDGSGHGWPLYAKITEPGTPLPPIYTDPNTGRYRVQVPAHTTFSLHVSAARAAGYQSTDRTVALGTSDAKQDMALTADPESCTAPGYQHVYTGMPAEPFDSSSVPAGWTVANATTNGGWEFNGGTVIPRTNQTDGSGNFAVADAFLQDAKDTTLTTPPVDLTGITDPVVGFHNYYVGELPSQDADVDVSVDGGATWSNLWHQTGPHIISGPIALPIPQAAGKSGVLVRFHFASSYGRYWELDDVYVGTRTCTPVAGGMVTGQVLDANTDEPVDGATVTSVDHPSEQTISAATPDDANLGDGYFSLFAAGSGTQHLTASARDRVSLTKSIDIEPDTLTNVDFALAAAQLKITPSSVSATVARGKTTQSQITVTNTGTSTAHVQLVEQPGDFNILNRMAANDRVPVQRIAAGAVATAAMTGRRPAKVTHGAGGSTPAPVAGSATSAWTPVADFPGGPIMDDAAARGDDGKVYVVGGTPDGYSVSASAYVYDPTRLLWSPIADLPVPVQQPSAAFVGGKLVVAGGWAAAGAVTTVQIYDPATGAWSVGAPLPAARAAAGAAVLAGKLYVVAGCDLGDCVPGAATVEVYDPAHDRWSTAADYPASEAFLACGGLDGTVVCAGGLDQTTGSGSAATYAYNPSTDTWTRRADLPTGWWASAYTIGNGRLLMSGGVAGGAAATSAVTNEGYSYDPVANAWQALPNAPAPFYRGAAACGAYRIGGAHDHFNSAATAQELAGYDLCGPSGDVPWLSENTTAFTLAPGQSTVVKLRLDASDPAVVDQPGAYQAQLAVRVDGPHQPDPVSVTMHVSPPATWAKVSGVVLGADCTGAMTPLSRATVTVQTKRSTVTLWTDDDGTWSLWIDDRDNPVTIAISKDRFTTVIKQVKVKSGGKVVDAVLQPARC